MRVVVTTTRGKKYIGDDGKPTPAEKIRFLSHLSRFTELNSFYIYINGQLVHINPKHIESVKIIDKDG